MRKLYSFLPLLALMVMAIQMKAQSCNPDFTLPDSVVVDPLPYTTANPTRGIRDTACVNAYYETVFQFQIPPTFSLNGVTVPVVSVDLATEGAVVNLPATFDYVCNPPNCVFRKDSTGCIVLYGTANPADVGVHDLKINVVVQVGIPFPVQLPNASIAPGNYYFYVKPEGSANCTVVSTFGPEAESFELKVQPNPMHEYAIMHVDAPVAGLYDLRLFNTMGQMVEQRRFDLASGANQIELDAAALPAGLYLYNLTNGRQAASGRLVVQH